MIAFDVSKVDFEKSGGLVCAVVQDRRTLQVLMVAWMDRAALDETLQSGEATFFSRSRQTRWRKGETSGNRLSVIDIGLDCDGDAVLVSVEPVGPACHLGTTSCFGEAVAPGLGRLGALERTVDQRAEASAETSGTARLLARGVKRVAQKVGEEGVETALAGAAGDDEELCAEAADLLYHLIVLLKARGLALTDVMTVLAARGDFVVTGPVPKPGILDIAPYVPGRATLAGVERPLKLSANENPFGCSEAALAAYSRAAADIHLYPDANTSRLRAAIAEKYRLEPDRLVFGAGSDEIFAFSAQAYLGPGDNAIQPKYGFAAWAIAVAATGAQMRSAPEPDFKVDVDAIIASLDERTRVVFVANPANPTGTWLPFSEIERLHAALPDQVLLILDGAYAECAANVSGFSDGLEWARERTNVLVTRTFSKAYGLASLRVGWAYGPPAVVSALDRIRLPFSVPRAGEAAAVAALGDEAFLERSLAAFEKGRDELTVALAELGVRTLSSATNFVTARFEDAGAVDAELARRGILVRRLANYGMPAWLRISVGKSQDMHRVIAALGEIASGAQSR